MSTIKVLHVIARVNVGGTARYVGDLVKYLPNNLLATGHVQGQEIEDAVVAQNIHFRIPHLGRRISPLNDLRAYFELKDIVRTLAPEIVHTHTFKAGLIGRMIPGTHKRIHTYHGHLFEDQSFPWFQKKLIKLVEKFLARRSDILVSVGIRVGHELQSLSIGKHNKWISIPPGIAALPIIEKAKSRELLGLSPNDTLVGWMARVTTVKNPNLLVEVANALPHIQFVMAGGGDLLNSIIKIAPRNLKVLGWTESYLFWSAVDISLSTSDNEGMPIALIEAQMAGIPVIATDVGSSSEVVQHKVTGLVVKKELSAIVAAVLCLTGDLDLLDQMAEAAISQSQEKFNLDKFLSRHQALQNSIANQ